MASPRLTESFATHAGHMHDSRQHAAPTNPKQPAQPLPGAMQHAWAPVDADAPSPSPSPSPSPAPTWPSAPPPGFTAPYYDPALVDDTGDEFGVTAVYSRNDILHGDAGAAPFAQYDGNPTYLLYMCYRGYSMLVHLSTREGVTYARA